MDEPFYYSFNESRGRECLLTEQQQNELFREVHTLIFTRPPRKL